MFAPEPPHPSTRKRAGLRDLKRAELIPLGGNHAYHSRRQQLGRKSRKFFKRGALLRRERIILQGKDGVQAALVPMEDLEVLEEIDP